ncbi:MAG: hypothetical protein V1909_03945 [Candidatus Micrarchaeota archaeon]
MPKKDGKIIITVHCDTVWNAASIKLLRRKKRRHYFGNLDNIICVAEVLRSVMPRVRDRRTKFYFTGAEETSMAGAKAVMKREGKALYIPIDLTTAARKADINVEWPYNVNKAELRRVLGKIPRLKVSFKTGHIDETAIYGKKYPTFSLNLPVDGHMHGRTQVSFWKARRFGRAVAEILNRVRKNYIGICTLKETA